MELTLNIPEYDLNKGIKYNWKEGFCIDVKYKNGAVILKANREGLMSLANHFLNLAQDAIPVGYHIHFDQFNSLENGSVEIIIEKVQ